ncbi:MAG: hypothetical protein J1E34_01520 [Oscillospiraceae bacterium]|nr:hypothetical protein [Oscillospiraceae bacterium]
MNIFQRFKKLNIDHSAIGLGQLNSFTPYFCTPKGAKVIGWAGVDGIHYCFIKDFGETVFAVNPSNYSGNNVHPIARSFEDMLSLLLACGSLDAVEQAHMWDETAFEIYIKENLPSEEQAAAIAMIREQLGIEPMEHPYAYIKALQNGFDYSKLKFSSDYYELLEPVEEQPPEWKVVYCGGFGNQKGRAGKEIALGKRFLWGKETWHIPAMYMCSKGLVIDFCIEVGAERVRAYTKKFDALHIEDESCSEMQLSRIQAANPLNIDFSSRITLDEEKIRENCSYGDIWIPESCLTDDCKSDLSVRWTLEHYGLDVTCGWVIRRVSFPWAGKRPQSIKSLNLTLEREMSDVVGASFKAPAAGESITLTNPITGKDHILTVWEREAQEIDQSRFRDDSMEYPTHCVGLTYTIFPELQNFYLRDCDKGDSPRAKKPDLNGIIGGAMGVIGMIISDGSRDEFFHPDGTPAKKYAFCSSMHFEPVMEPELNIVFREKHIPDVEVKLI